ncbi:MAG: cupin domain-containing protein, partial [Anaerolineaceae bacterium]|nr:cupin domain-containing protein [Anaerolineaceae bacterium]
VVRVPPGCKIGLHTHSDQIETIYVLSGISVFTIAGALIAIFGGRSLARRLEKHP